MTTTTDKPEETAAIPERPEEPEVQAKPTDPPEPVAMPRFPARTGGGSFRTSAIILVVANIGLLAAGVASSFWFFGANIGIAGMSVALPAAGLCTFIVLFTDHGDIRTAVMGTFTVLYLGFVSATFNSDFAKIMADRDGMGRHVYDSFNTFMLVMLGFYFSGKAVEMVAKTRIRR